MLGIFEGTSDGDSDVGLNVSSLNSVGNDVDGTNDGWEEGSVDILGMKLG